LKSLNYKKNFQDQFKVNKEGWVKSFNSGLSQDKNGEYLPWMTYPAIEFLKNNLTNQDSIFEFGCGASTLFFSKIVKNIISLETNEVWFNIIKEKISCEKASNNHNRIILKDNIINNVDDFFYHGNGVIFLIKNGQDNSIYENFLDEIKQLFSFIIIDSLKRFSCSCNSIKFLRKKGSIILDDSQRKSYKKIFRFLDENDFTSQDFLGIAPGQIKPKKTTFFTKLTYD